MRVDDGSSVKEGFNRDYKAISGILKNDAGVKAAVRSAAAGIAADAGGEVEEYETDRFVAGVKVEGHRQATDGVLTKAVGARGKTLS